jgi:2,4-dienoyl-CoA reductase-like NADH-dependent reductase (Old Yellow Enzyme family)
LPDSGLFSSVIETEKHACEKNILASLLFAFIMSNETSDPLFTPWSIGPIELKHRIVLAPLTRIRAEIDTLDPNDIMSEYYEQRASDGGLIITEATYPSSQSGGMVGTPGLYNDEHVRRWKVVTDKIHAKGGKVVVQLWALGRTQDGKSGIRVVSASDIGIDGKPTPEALDEKEIQSYIDDYATSAKLAMEAGFDGIEVHGARK